jgi:neutral ceramidase
MDYSRMAGGMSVRRVAARPPVISVLLAIMMTSPPTGWAAESALKVGAGAADFTATDDMTIAGGIGGGKVQGQEGSLRAVAVVVEHPTSGKFAIVACDVLFVTDAMVRAAAAEIDHRCGIPIDHLLVNATHTHSAPSTVRVHGYGPEPEFVKNVIDGIVRAVEQADGHRTDNCRFAYRLGEESTVGANSRLLLSDNTIYWIGSREDAVRPTGPFDPQLPVLTFYGPGDRLRGLIFNHSTHTIGTLRPNVRSPSFYGLAAQELEKELDATVCFLEGASGSTHNIGGVTTAVAITRMKQAVTAALAKAETRPVDRIAALKRPFKFRVRTFDEATEDAKVLSYCRKRAPDHADAIAAVFRQMRLEMKPEQGRERKTSLQVLLIGDVAIVGVPAEYFTSLGVDIKHRSPIKDTLVAELANDWIGYLPDREGYELGGYQTWMGWHSYAEPGTGERIADEVVSMLAELKSGKSR